MIPSKKVVSISMVKNECDIIELFVRCNLQFLDEMYIIEHKCSDSTLDILLELKKEGLPIRIFRYNAYDFNQGQVFNTIKDKIMSESNVDFILFCDADELIYAPSKDSFLQSLVLEENNYYHINEYNYDINEGAEIKDIPLYDKFVYKKNSIFTYKAIANLRFLRGQAFRVCEGGHTVNHTSNGAIFPYRCLPESEMFLAHVPYRSKEQMLSKVLLGCLSYNAIRPNFKYSGYDGHWYAEFDRIINGGEVQVQSTNVPVALQSNIDAGVYRYVPIKFNGPIKYVDKIKIDALENLINFSIGYIKFHNDETNRQDLMDMLLNLDRNDKNTSIYTIIKSLAPYVDQKSVPPYNPANIQEIIF